MRWRFVDPSHPAEVAAKERKLRTIDAWWAELARRTEDLRRVFRRELEMDLPGWMQEHLGAVDEHLCWEFGPPLRGGEHRLVITPESHSELRPLVATLIERAPRLPGWEFYPYRPRESVEEALRSVEGRVGRTYEDVEARVVAGSHNLVDLTFRSADFPSDDDEDARHAAFVLTESLLGEEAMDRWVGGVGVEPARPGPRLVGETEPEPDWLALDRLQPAFAAQLAALQGELPPTPWHEVDLEDHAWGGFEVEPGDEEERGRADLITGITPYAALTEAIFAVPFRSERFSRFGETFCYLKVDRGEADGVPDASEREPVEQAIDGALVPSRLGRTIGGGTGRRHFYVELALMDVERALPLLRERLRAIGVPRRSWLLFHDVELANEWVGIHDETPAPPGTPPILG